jgi:A/G-specific adenine glycosylase
MQRFPTLESVANAHPDALLKAWEGLGYYSRVRNIHKSAQILVREHGGLFPSDPDALRALPGIGDYTAGAILSIAFNLPCPAVDANVARVFSRIFDIDMPVKSPAAADFIRHMAASLIPRGQARQFNQALMELGALVCAKKTRCEHCPVKQFCQAQRLGIVPERPVPGKKLNYSALEVITGVLAHKGRLFLQKRLDSGVWAGFWEFPGGRLEKGESPPAGIVREYEEETELHIAVREKLGLVRHSYTRYTISLHCFLCALAEIRPNGLDEAGFPLPALHAATEYRWVLPHELDDYTLPAGHRKLVDAWLPRLREAAKAEN